MIFDTLKNHHRYHAINERIAKGFDYLTTTNLENLAVGKHEIDGENLFAIVQEYTTKDHNECKLEGHKKYIDIQLMIRGEEKMGIAKLNNQTILEQNLALDYTFYEGDVSLVRLEQGMFALFFPGDLHQTCIQTEKISEVKKIVLKILD